MKKILLFLFCIANMQIMAQEEKLRVTLNVGDPLKFSLKDIKDITFVEDEIPLDIIGEWFCEEVEKYGTFESIEFREDGTSTTYAYWVNLHSGLTILGRFNFENYMLMTQNSTGIQIYPITSHSKNSFMLTMGKKLNYTYYRVQKVYNMKTSDEPISIGNKGDVVTFVDNEFITIDNNKIKALKGGSGYALLKDSVLNEIVAYRVNVESVIDVKQWEQYFKKTQDEIITEFGEPILSQPSDNMDQLVYYGIDSTFGLMSFGFDKDTKRMFIFQGLFENDEGFESYKSEIERRYIKDEEKSTDSVLYYYDTENSIVIVLNITQLSIIYMDMTE